MVYESLKYLQSLKSLVFRYTNNTSNTSIAIYGNMPLRVDNNFQNVA